MSTLTERKQAAIVELQKRSFWKATQPSIQQQILGLPDDCAGYLEDLINRQIEVGGVRKIAISELIVPDACPIFSILTIYLVQSLKDPSLAYRYQYHSWKHGPNSGSKGLLFVRNGFKLTHLLCLRGESFAVGGPTFDTFGGFIEVKKDDINKMVGNFKREISEEMGLKPEDELDLEEIIPLGRLFVDRGLTNNHPFIFAAVVNGEKATKIKTEEDAGNPDPYEMRSGTFLVPIKDVSGQKGFAMQNDDGYFLSIMMRMVALGRIVLS